MASEATHGDSNISPAMQSAGRRILVVDDNRDSARTLARLLEVIGHEARIVYDGGEAVAMAEAYHPEVILLDIGLPVMNGYEVARTIRRHPWGTDIVIVALTGWGQLEDRKRSKEAGIDHHLVKPVEPQALIDLLSRMAKGGPS
jgi:CheY-like chemotaxis protein